jgi:hypothetical protein
MKCWTFLGIWFGIWEAQRYLQDGSGVVININRCKITVASSFIMNLYCGLRATEESRCQNPSFINICLKWQGRGVEDKITFSYEYESATFSNKQVIIVLRVSATEGKKNSIKLKKQMHRQEGPRRPQSKLPEHHLKGSQSTVTLTLAMHVGMRWMEQIKTSRWSKTATLSCCWSSQSQATRHHYWPRA